MEIKQLKLLDAVVRHKNFTRAADELFISQPSLSMSIKNFEKELGFKLFERNRKGLVLTEQGKTFHLKSLNIINRFEHLEKESKIIQERGVEVLKIGVIESYRKFIPDLVSCFLDKNPNMNISIVERNSNDVLEELLNYNIHFGLTTNTIIHNDINSINVLKQNTSVIFHKNHSFAYLRDISIQDFEGETLIQSQPGYQLYDLITKKISLNNITLSNEISVETLESALEMIRHNLGVAIIPSSYTQKLNDSNIKALHFHEDNNDDININLIYNKNRYLAKPIYEFIKHIELRSTFKDI